MASDEALAAARHAVKVAVGAGATQAEANVSIGRRFSTEARLDTVTKLEQATVKSLVLRLFVKGRKVALSTADFDPTTLQSLVVRGLAQAEHVDSDPLAQLPETGEAPVEDLELYDPVVAGRSEADGTDDALRIERAVAASDPRIVNSNGARYGAGMSVTALANSNGFAGVYRSTRVSRSASPVALDGEYKRTAYYGTAGRRLSDLDSNEEVASRAARRTLEMFGAKKPPTMRAAVIFERDVASAVLSDVFAAVNAANVVVGNSWLIDRVGEKIGSEAVTIVDDGRVHGLLGSAPFDAEGVLTRRTPVVENGVLQTFLYDSYNARKLGARSTGNSAGGSIGPNNFFMEAGERTLDELIHSTKRGILVLDTIGFSTEHATGSYSRGARGMLIVDGELAHPVDEFTIAAPLLQMLAAIDGIANDLRFDATIVAPSFRVSEMTISGN